jgi:hypothetical protein
VQGLLGSEIVGAQSENVVINGLPYSSQAASFVTRSGLQVCCSNDDTHLMEQHL